MPSLFNEYKSRKLVGVTFMVHCARNKSKSLNKKPYFRNGITCEINHGAEMNVVLAGGPHSGDPGSSGSRLTRMRAKAAADKELISWRQDS